MTRPPTLLTKESLAELAAHQQPPCLSLYQPTHRRHPENQQDPIRFRNLVRELESSLHRQFPEHDARPLLEPFQALSQDNLFWRQTLDGLALLACPAAVGIFRLQQTVPELALVAESFHTKPLRQFLQAIGRYQILGLSLDRIKLFEGSRDSLDEIEPAPGVPRTVADALGEQLTEPHQTVASYGGVGQGSSPMHHTKGSKPEEVEVDAERFFRAVDRAILQYHSRPSGLPLILAALPEHHHRFHQVSHNPFLLRDGLTTHPDALPPDELRTRAWQIANQQFQSRLAALADEFAEAKSGGRGSDDLTQVALAAVAGRVATLALESGRRIYGRLDPSTGSVEVAGGNTHAVDDLLDDLGELVDRMGGEVLVIPREHMPVTTGLAATYRY